MKKDTRLFACTFVLLLAAVSAHAQFGGFTWQFAPVPVAQVVQTFPNKAQGVMQGNIVAFLGGDRYLFRDASGGIVVKIKHNRWWGQVVGPNDLVELSGELKRDKRSQWINYFDARVVRRIGQGTAPANETLMFYQGRENTGTLQSGESEAEALRRWTMELYGEDLRSFQGESQRGSEPFDFDK